MGPQLKRKRAPAHERRRRSAQSGKLAPTGADLNPFDSNLINSSFRPGLVEGWRRRGLIEPTPVQRRAMERLLAEPPGDSRNWLVLAPTGSGKTGAAEIALADALSRGRKAVYLVPTRALAEEKLREFARWLAPAGMRALCATRERPETDAAVARGEFDLLIAIYEKLDHYLITAPGLMDSLDCVVADEIQMIADEERGGAFDLLLTRLRLASSQASSQLRLVGLTSALCLNDARAMASWLDAELILETARPRPLREGTFDLSEGLFTFRSIGGALEIGEEPLAGPDEMAALREAAREAMWEVGRSGAAARGSDAIGALAAAALLAGRGEPTLIFAPSRALSVDLARALAAALTRRHTAPAPAGMIMARLMDGEPCRARDTLIETLAAGVAFHNADLDDHARALIEEGFNAGEIMAVVATPTLGMGVNLVGQNVVQFPWRHAGSARSASKLSRTARVPLGRSRFLNQGGRAARLGATSDDVERDAYGRSMVVGEAAETCERLWEELIDADLEPVDSALRADPLETPLIKILGWSAPARADELIETLAATWASAQRSNTICPESWLSDSAAQAALDRLVKMGAALRDPATAAYSLTGLGESAAASGVGPATAAALTHAALCDELTRPAGGFASAAWTRRALFALALSEEGRLAIAGAGGRFNSSESPPADEDHPDAQPAEFELELIERPGGPSASERRAMIMARALADWISPMPTPAFERKWRVCHGGFARIAADFQWLARAMAALARRSAADRDQIEAIESLAERLGTGIPESARELARLRVPGLTRGGMTALAESGLRTAEAILAAPTPRIIDVIGVDLADRIESAAHDWITRRPLWRRPLACAERESSDENIEMRSNGARVAISATSPPRPRRANVQPAASIGPALEINLKSPGVIRAAGEEIVLTPMCFELLAALAERPGQVVTRQSLYHRLWPGGGPEEQQLDGHRRKLIERLRPALGQTASRVAEVIRGVGFRLSWPDDQIALLR